MLERLGIGMWLYDKEQQVIYGGFPVVITAGSHTLEVGKAKDLGVERHPRPDTFLIMEKGSLSQTKAVNGEMALLDGGEHAVFFGRNVSHGFKGWNDHPEGVHFAVKRKGDTITVRDMGTKTGTKVTVKVVKHEGKAS